jgi:hypothetical protein
VIPFQAGQEPMFLHRFVRCRACWCTFKRTAPSVGGRISANLA